MNPHRAGCRADADRGAVAIIAALVVTLVLVPVTAMTADLGVAYVRAGDLQQVADVAARAAADELARLQRDEPAPAAVIDAARTAAVQAVCAAAGTSGGTTWSSACTDPSWASDGNPGNGEVSFYTGTPDPTSHGFTTAQAVIIPESQDWITGVRVVTPPLRVEFGLAAAFTTDHAVLQKASSAGIFTVLPRYGFFPMYLTTGEYGSFCTRGAPKHAWGPYGPLCPPDATSDRTIARGYVAAARTDSTENSAAITWNAAIGIDRDHLPLPGTALTLAEQYYYSYNWARVSALADGLFVGTPGGEQPGRLTATTCPGGNGASSGPYSAVQSAYLTDFLDSRIADKYAFADTVQAPDAPPTAQRGWLDPAVLRCGRLAVVPVLTPYSAQEPLGIQVPPPYDGLDDDSLTWTVTGLRLIWMDDRLWSTDASPIATGQCFSRGFYWEDQGYAAGICTSQMRVYTGYVLDPRLLPAIVSGQDATNVLDSFVGEGMPATVRLLRDVSDPPAS